MSCSAAKTSDYYRAAAGLVGYKRFDLIVKAFNRLKWPLKILATVRNWDV